PQVGAAVRVVARIGDLVPAGADGEILDAVLSGRDRVGVTRLQVGHKYVALVGVGRDEIGRAAKLYVERPRQIVPERRVAPGGPGAALDGDGVGLPGGEWLARRESQRVLADPGEIARDGRLDAKPRFDRVRRHVVRKAHAHRLRPADRAGRPVAVLRHGDADLVARQHDPGDGEDQRDRYRAHDQIEAVQVERATPAPQRRVSLRHGVCLAAHGYRYGWAGRSMG